MNKRLSIIVPVFNEERNLPILVKRIVSSLSKKSVRFEIIIVDDHSTDKTAFVSKKLAKSKNVKYFLKRGKKGKAYSIIQGIQESKFENISFIDADLQYPPEAILPMLQKIKECDIVVANRKIYRSSLGRKIASRTFKKVFGKTLFRLDSDIQAGLKVFKRDVVESISMTSSSAWTFDLEFLHRANDAGFKIKNYDIVFEERKRGASNVSIIKQSWEIGLSAINLKLASSKPAIIKPGNSKNMKGAGLRFGKKKFITHTTLPAELTAQKTFTRVQKFCFALIIELIVLGFVINSIATVTLLLGILSFVYFSDTVFNFFLVFRSLAVPQEIEIPKSRILNLEDKNLPVYTILCPLYKEAHIIPEFVKNISNLNWPKNKLDVLLLLEEDDKESILAAKSLDLPSFIRTIVVPASQPKTKPKACNYGLSFAKGEYLVIYDAEDRPEKDQLKKIFIAFKDSSKNIVCLQAKLNYYNPTQNLLTRFFTAEYSLWFDVSLTGMQSINTLIPLGGTSNHFKIDFLKKLKGWDPFNVTEDADLGMRLFKEGYRTAIVDSTTLEEANSRVGNWIRQRSRWIKGYMQTYLVHSRNPIGFAKKQKFHFPIFNLIIGGKIAFILINPILWLATLSYFSFYAYVGPAIERVYPAAVFYLAAFSLVFGNFLFMYYYMIGVMKRNQFGLIKFVFLIPIYWLMISVAGFMALHQLFFKPFYWEKTLHGLHIKNESREKKNTITKKSWRPNFPTIPTGLLPAPFKLAIAGLVAVGEIEKNTALFLAKTFKKILVLPIKTAISLFI